MMELLFFDMVSLLFVYGTEYNHTSWQDLVDGPDIKKGRGRGWMRSRHRLLCVAALPKEMVQ